MVISLLHKILFFHISKTAGTSTASILDNMFDDTQSSFNEIFVKNINHNAVKHIVDKFNLMGNPALPFTHITQTDARPFLDINHIDTSDFYEFIIVRNPYERIKSQIIYQKLNDVFSVNTYLTKYEELNSGNAGYWFNKQIDYAKDPITKNLHVYKFEEIHKLWHFIADISSKPFEMVVVNQTPKKYMNEIHLTLTQKRRIYHMFRDDFDYFGYPKGF